MDLPLNLKNAIELMVEGEKLEELKAISFKLTEKYKYESGNNASLIGSKKEVLVYSIVRMPATFGAVYDTLTYVNELNHFGIKSLIDVGAGTGAGTWAANSFYELTSIQCLEKDENMMNVGKELMKEDDKLQRLVQWQKYDLLKDELKSSADLILSSYVLNELDFNQRRNAVIDMWSNANKVLLIIEPGTKVGFSIIKEIRSIILKLGGHIIAPCPHENECPVKEDDWCHFACRVQRSKIHKLIKDGDAPFEDEKYAYIAFSKEEVNRCQNRIMRHPYITKGKIDLTVCNNDGIKNISIRKKDGDVYKKAKKCKQGDTLNTIN